jgi:hypothetical protein
MIGYHRKLIIELLTLVHQARVSPFDNPTIWRLIQEKLIKQLSKTESKIRLLKDEIKRLNFIRKNPQERLSKEESSSVKNQLDYLDYKLEEYRRLIRIYKSIGDAVAFTFISKWDIKPQNFKQPSGFITEKVGFKKEKRIFRYIFKKGGIAILNDLTSALKYCDITMVSEGGFVPIEVKSSKNVNKRVGRQKSNADKLFSYIFEDKSDSLYGIEGRMRRVAMQSNEVNYIQIINELIDNSKKNGFAYKLVEQGVLYFVAHQDPNEKEDSKKMFEGAQLLKPTAFFLNSMKFNELGYYPFSLSFTNPENYFDFLQGKFVINIFIDFDVITQIAHQYGFTFHEREEPDFPYEFRSIKDGEDFGRFMLSYHYFGRVLVEFVSLKWLMTDSFERLNEKFFEDPDNDA